MIRISIPVLCALPLIILASFGQTPKSGEPPKISAEGGRCLQWHGFYEVAKHFYTELAPEAERLMPGVTAEFMKTDYHK